MATADEVASMSRKLHEVVARDGWKSDRSVVTDVQRILSKLTTLKVDVELLKRTNVGRVVSKLRKHDDEVVRGYSTCLTNKWMDQVGVPGRSRESSSERKPAPAPVPPQPSPGAINDKRLQEARRRVQQGYASERAKKDSRTIQMLNHTPAKRRKGTTISAAPSRSTIVRVSVPTKRAPTVVAASSMRRAQTSSAALPRARPVSTTAPSGRPLTKAELEHQRRQAKLRAAAGVDRGRNGTTQGKKTADSRAKNDREEVRSTDPRKMMLDKMFPRVCGVGSETKTTTTTKKTTTAAKKPTKSKAASYTEGQREVLAWLRDLPVDMSEYAQAFFDNGFDSVKLLSTIRKDDLPGLVPKKGHHRVIQQALDDLKRKQTTSARARSRPPPKDVKRKGNPYSDIESDDSFVVSDGDEYAPGAIAAMFRKNRKRRYSIDSTDSYNMEATFDEIQHEEERSSRYGEYEDYREELRNKKLAKKKK